jgi:hypothetical protein
MIERLVNASESNLYISNEVGEELQQRLDAIEGD